MIVDASGRSVDRTRQFRAWARSGTIADVPFEAVFGAGPGAVGAVVEGTSGERWPFPASRPVRWPPAPDLRRPPVLSASLGTPDENRANLDLTERIASFVGAEADGGVPVELLIAGLPGRYLRMFDEAGKLWVIDRQGGAPDGGPVLFPRLGQRRSRFRV